MLVLARKTSESILIGDDIRITIVQIGRGRVQIGIEAPRDIGVRRQELPPRNQPSSLLLLRARVAKPCEIAAN